MLLWTGGMILGIGILVGIGLGILQEQLLYTFYPEYYWQHAFVEDTLIAEPVATFDPIIGRVGALLYGTLFGTLAGFWLTLMLVVFCLIYAFFCNQSGSITPFVRIGLIGAIVGAIAAMLLSLGLSLLMNPGSPAAQPLVTDLIPTVDKAILVRVTFVQGSTLAGAILGQWGAIATALRFSCR